MIDLDGAVVCVTRGARGIGRATAVELLRRGARVWIGDVDADEAERTAREIGSRSAHLDVTQVASMEAFHAAACSDGPVAMLVNNAGIQVMGTFVDQFAVAPRMPELKFRLVVRPEVPFFTIPPDPT